MNPYGVMNLFKNVKNVKSNGGGEKMAELLLTRFTHDIAGPIGAVVNGLDFVMHDARDTEDPGGIEIKNQAIDIIDESSKQSLARLQAYRMAYGVVYNENAKVATREIKDIMGRYFSKSHIDLIWNPSVPEGFPVNRRRICVGMILTLARVFIYGGKISVSFSGENKNTIEVRGTAPKYKEPEMIRDILLNKKEIEMDVDNVPYFFIREATDSLGGKITFEYKASDEEKQVTYITEFPNI
ncbi:MAG: histidine phosphotransferase family protein [Rickettsiales bacterium]|nr:histidine phosphotransferase family protein [Rickettsiales bacterium]